ASEVKSLATSTGTKVIVNEPLVVNTGGVTLAPSSTFEVANTVDVTGNVEVGSGSKLNFTTANTLKITGDLILKADNAGTFSANLGSGGINVVGSGKVKYQRTIDDTKWYFMAFPCDVNVSEITGGGAIDVDWFIQQYNGQKRATNGAGANWEHVTSGVLTANRGYIFGSAAGDKTLTFLLTKAIVASESAKTIGVTNYTGATASTNYGWNLVGQPYISKYDANNGSNMSNMYIFDGLTYKDHYNNIYKQDLPVVDPFTAYFTKVVANGSLSFDLTSRQSTRSSVSTIIADVVYLDFTTATGTDRTNIVMDDTQSANYQNGVDYEKMITTGTAIPQVYTVLDGLNYSFNVLPTSSVVNLPLAIYTKTAGSTTISVDATKAKSLSKLLLLENGVVVADLLTSDYKFTAASGTSTTRFSITAQRIATDNNQIGNNLDAPKLSIVNCQLSIENLSPNSSVRVYDALGRMLVSKTANSNMMEIKLGARGIYTVLLQNGTTISTRKIIF
ncbi:MAG: T9SS type A sorting domain-containing protein, partial [Paludibacter sp.]